MTAGRPSRRELQWGVCPASLTRTARTCLGTVVRRCLRLKKTSAYGPPGIGQPCERSGTPSAFARTSRTERRISALGSRMTRKRDQFTLLEIS
jgi:hypothetical protein